MAKFKRMRQGMVYPQLATACLYLSNLTLKLHTIADILKNGSSVAISIINYVLKNTTVYSN